MEHERGAALLTVLLLVAVLAALSVAAMDMMRLSVRLEGNSRILTQSRYMMMGAETLARIRIGELRRRDRGRTTLAGNWNGQVHRLPVPGGMVSARISDATHCFNLNSLVEGESRDRVARPQGIKQFTALMEGLGIARDQARQIAAASADWIDSDTTPIESGGEDSLYARAEPPYRTANQLMVEPSELRAVAGVTPGIYRRLRPWLCALPTTDLSPINVNTLPVEKALLVDMLFNNQLGETQARAAIERRPADGWGSEHEFLSGPALGGLTPDGEANRQIRITTRYFGLDATADVGGVESEQSALLEAKDDGRVNLVARRWTVPE